MRSTGIAYLLWFIGIFGCLGLHRFYLGKVGTGILWLLTGGVLGIGALIDLFTLGSQVEQYNTRMELKTMRANSLYQQELSIRAKEIRQPRSDFDQKSEDQWQD